MTTMGCVVAIIQLVVAAIAIYWGFTALFKF